MSPIALGAYNPSQVPKPVLLAEFTARRGMMDDLLSVMRGNEPDHPCQHSLLIGPRGFGKTTSLYALKYRLEDDPQLAEKWIPLLFDEENYHLGDLAGFWLECLRLAEIALQRKGATNYASLHTSRDPKLEEQACEAFLSLLDEAKRRALLLVDNLNDVLDAVADDAAQHRLRALLLEESRVCLVGTACTYFEAISSTDRPFYQLFRVFRLDSFTVSEMKDALKAMAAARPNPANVIQWPTQEGYWKGLHILTGGNPRLVKIIYQLMERGVTPDFQSQLEGLLDAYTPYFKHRIESMSPQQRRVFDAIALAWDAVQISDIAPGLRMDSNQVSAQIKALTDAQLIAIRGGSAKRKTYQVADRFSNIYYFMRFSRAGRSRFEWFIRTMKIVLTPDQYEQQLQRMRELTLGCDDARSRQSNVHLLANATMQIDNASDRNREWHKNISWLLKAKETDVIRELLAESATREAFAEHYDILAFISSLSKSRKKQIGYKPDSGDWWLSVARALEKTGDWELAKTACEAGIKTDESNPWLHMFLADMLYYIFDKNSDAEISYRKARELDPTNVWAWVGIGSSVSETLERAGEAEAAFLKAAQIDPNNWRPWAGLAELLDDQPARWVEAEQFYLKAVKLNPENPVVWHNFAHHLEDHLHKSVEAETAFRESIRFDPTHACPFAGLALILQRKSGTQTEARSMAAKAVELSASAEWPRRVFTQVALYHRDSCIRALRAITNALAANCVEGRSQADEDLQAFGLNVIATLLALGDHKSVTSILMKSKAVQSLEIGLEAARLKDNSLLTDRVAPERLELVNAFLEKVAQRRSEISSTS